MRTLITVIYAYACTKTKIMRLLVRVLTRSLRAEPEPSLKYTRSRVLTKPHTLVADGSVNLAACARAHTLSLRAQSASTAQVAQSTLSDLVHAL